MAREQPQFRAKSKQLIGMFRELFPQFQDEIKLWGPFDKDAIKIETKNKSFYVFTYYNPHDWGLQTYKNYIDCRRMIPKA